MSKPPHARFPDGFLWGTATASYQVEGAVGVDGRGASIWDTFSHTPGATFHGDTGDIACDQYNRVAGDVALMEELGVRAYRFSISWPRIQPEGRGAPLEAGLDYYRRLVALLRDASIEPAVTLYHWDLPQALQDLGGWESRETADRFADFAHVVAGAIGDEVGTWITLNEPWVSSFMGYGTGEHAPGITSLDAALRAAHHLHLAHGKALQVLRAGLPSGAQVGITLNLSPVRPVTGEPEDVAAATRLDGYLNRWFLDPIRRGSYPEDLLGHFASLGSAPPVEDGDLEIVSAPIDFLGVNYYSARTVGASRDDASLVRLGAADAVVPGTTRTAMGWPIVPEGLTELLVRVERDYGPVPLYVTENGAAFDDYVDPSGEVKDPERVAYLEAHLRAARAAIDQGVDLRGYFVWSFLDNFEWAEGYSKRFGIVYVDYGTQRRIPKQSAHWYAGVVAANGLS
jgi:beta-glucosidase